MVLFISFVFGAVILGAGAMLAPAWRTVQPRVALAGTFSLALVMGGAVFWSSAFGWNTLIVDYMLFALLTGVLVGGSLSSAQMRAEAHGIVLEDKDQGWPGPQDLAFFVVVGVAIVVIVLSLPVPLGTDAPALGYMALVAKSGSFTSLAPFHPEIETLTSPGLSALVAYLSGQLRQPISDIQLGVGAVLALLCVWLAYDMGAEIRDKRLGRAMAVAFIIGLGGFLTFLDGHYSALLGLAFTMAFIIYALRYQRDGLWYDAVAAGLMLGATLLADATVTFMLILGYAAWLVTMHMGEDRPNRMRWLVMLLGVPLVTIIATGPWLMNTWSLLTSGNDASYSADLSNLSAMLLHHGLIIVPIAIMGAILSLKQRAQMGLLAVGWLVLLVDFAVIGLLAAIFPPLHNMGNPFYVAWFGAIVPYTLLGGYGLLWIWEHIINETLRARLYRTVYVVAAIALVGSVVVGVLLGDDLRVSARDLTAYPGLYTTEDDINAMLWIRDNADDSARVLNYPSRDSLWVAVISERDAVFFPQVVFYRGEEAALDSGETLLAFWYDPANPDHSDLLAEADITYVIVPALIAVESRIATQSDVADAAYLDLVYESGAAQVYQMR